MTDTPESTPTESAGSSPAASEGGDKAAAPKAKGGPTDQRKLLLAVGVLIFVAVVAVGVGIARKNNENKAAGSSTPAAGSTGTTAGTGCLPGTWPALYMGTPKNLSKGTDSGYYLWNDGVGWHLRTIDPAGTSFKGTITSTVKIDPKRVKVVPDGVATVSVDSNTLNFQMTGTATAGGIDFQVGCTADQFSAALATTEGLPYPSSGIYVGKDGHPLTNPVVVVRK